MTTLHFARHGQASFGKSNYDKLSPLGERQAALLGSQYHTNGRKIDAVVSGSLLRQRESAIQFLSTYQPDNTLSNGMLNDSMLNNKTITNDVLNNDILNNSAAKGNNGKDSAIIFEGLNEFNHKDVLIKFNPAFANEIEVMQLIASSPIPKIRLAELFNEAMLRWHSGDFDADYIESWSAFNQRVQRTLQEIIDYAKQQKLEDMLIFTSGGVIAAITAQVLSSYASNVNDADNDNSHANDNNTNNEATAYQNSRLAYRLNRSLINTGVTSVIMKEDSPRLLSMNEHSHLFQEGKSLVTFY